MGSNAPRMAGFRRVRRRCSRRRLLLAVLAAWPLALAPGCGQSDGELLIVYSGDCQGYLDPCG